MQHAKMATTLFYRPFPIFQTLCILEFFPIPILLSAYPYPFEHLPPPPSLSILDFAKIGKNWKFGPKTVKID